MIRRIFLSSVQTEFLETRKFIKQQILSNPFTRRFFDIFVFERRSRDVSHGCVRVSKPFDLAQFVLDSPDEWLLDRIRIAMGIPAETERGIDYESNHPESDERNKLISYVSVKPRVPLYIIYYTLWPDESGMMQTWPDVYGYDDVVWNSLKPYM